MRCLNFVLFTLVLNPCYTKMVYSSLRTCPNMILHTIL